MSYEGDSFADTQECNYCKSYIKNIYFNVHIKQCTANNRRYNFCFLFTFKVNKFIRTYYRQYFITCVISKSLLFKLPQTQVFWMERNEYISILRTKYPSLNFLFFTQIRKIINGLMNVKFPFCSNL